MVKKEEQKAQTELQHRLNLKMEQKHVENLKKRIMLVHQMKKRSHELKQTVASLVKNDLSHSPDRGKDKTVNRLSASLPYLPQAGTCFPALPAR